MVQVLTDVFRSFEVADKEGQPLRINEGDSIRFVTENGHEVITGIVTKLQGKGEKAKVQIIPFGEAKEEIWSVTVMADGSLEVVNEE